MIHQFTNTNGKEFLAVGVPLDSTDIKLLTESNPNIIQIAYSTHNPFTIHLDTTEFDEDFKAKLIGISSELTEEQIIEMRLVGIMQIDKQVGYFDYLNDHISFRFESAKESLQSRLKSFGFDVLNEKQVILKKV